MMIKVEFEANSPDFIKLSKREPNPQIRVRLIAMELLKNGESMEKVAQSIGAERHAVGKWYRRYKKFGLLGLENLPKSGARPKLPKEKEAEFVKKIAELQQAKKGGRIIGNDIQKMAQEEFGIDYADDTIYVVLKRLKMSWITARSKHPKADEEAQEAFKRDFKKKFLRHCRRRSA